MAMQHCVAGLKSLEHIPRSGVAASYGSSTFGLMRSLHGDVHKGCICLHLSSSVSPESFPLSPHPGQCMCHFFSLDAIHSDR